MNTKSKTLISVLMFILLIGCQKDMFVTDLSDGIVKDLTIDEAKAYYNKELKPIKIQKIASIIGHNHDENHSHNITEQLMWDKSDYRQLIAGNQAVLVPIHLKDVFIKVGENKVVSYGLLNYTMMYRDSLNNIITEKVLLQPSLKWFEGDRSKYDGSVLVRDWAENVKAIYHFVDGNLINNKNIIDKQANINKTASTSSRCLYFTVTVVSAYGCSNGGHMPWDTACSWNFGGVVPTGEYRAGYNQDLVTYEFCDRTSPIDPLEPPSTGGGSPPSQGGGGSPSGNDYIPSNCTPDDQIDYTVPLNPGETYAVPCSQMQEPIESPTTTAYDMLNIIFQDLTNEEKAYLISHELVADQIISTIIEGGEGSYDFARWGITELSKGNITWGQFYNGFLMEYSGVQSDIDPSMAINTNWLNNSSYFSYQNLPSLTTFTNNYPKNAEGTYEMSAGSVYFLVGGDVLNMKVQAEKIGKGEYYNNACALRVSLALIKSGITIPYIPNVTFKGKDINGSEAYFFLRAKDLYDWMMKEFYQGNRIDLTNADRININGDGFKNSLNGKQGIYLFIPTNSNDFGATGHAGIYTNPPLTEYYFGWPNVKNISLWELH